MQIPTGNMSMHLENHFMVFFIWINFIHINKIWEKDIFKNVNHWTLESKITILLNLIISFPY
jgi:hypothetical protein